MTTRKEMKFVLPAGSIMKRCNGCEEMIHWIKMPSGKMMPVNHDGTSHFATCPKAAEFRKSREKRDG